MKIGYDAKRAFHNGTGLGHYSRTLLRSLAHYFPIHDYYLFNPNQSAPFTMKGASFFEINPTGLHTLFPAAWRSGFVKTDLKKFGIELYHGLSHEIPRGIHRTGIPSVVTMHDLIHERYPEQYSAIDVKIYSKKFRYACRHADRIIAISEQTKNDLIEFYQAEAGRIEICYQSCNPAFSEKAVDEEKTRVRQKYGLPPRFFLYVGSVIERKNLLGLCQALALLPPDTRFPLVVIGKGVLYLKKVKQWLEENQMSRHVIFLSEQDVARDPGFQQATDFPVIYQLAIAMIYPSFFEGFGIPVLEALASGTPVITSNRSSLPEAGGEAALYVDPSSAKEMAAAMDQVATDVALRQRMIEKGYLHANKFSPLNCAQGVMNVYQQVVQSKFQRD